jgi:hypothetical protein
MPDLRPTRLLLERIWDRTEAREAARIARARITYRANRFRENVGTMMLGTSSLAMAIVISVVTLGGLFGVIREPWTERQVVLAEKKPREVISRRDPATGQYSYGVAYVDVGYIGMPTGNTVSLGWLSLILGGIGLALSMRERRVSWLCAAGFVMTLVMMALGMAPVLLFEISR